MRKSAAALATALLAALLTGLPLALASAQPFPPARPKAPVAEHPAPQKQPQLEAQPAPVDPGPGKAPEPAVSADVVNKCIGALQAMGADAQSTQAGQRGSCFVGAPVSLRGVRTGDGEMINIEGGVTLDCPFAIALAAWIRDDVARIAGAKLSRLSGVGGFECRLRNRQTSGLVSEHAKGGAFDLRRLVYDDGRSVELMGSEPEHRALREALRASACARFTTVLGAGADGYHEDHLHVDMRARGGGYRICDWALP